MKYLVKCIPLIYLEIEADNIKEAEEEAISRVKSKDYEDDDIEGYDSKVVNI